MNVKSALFIITVLVSSINLFAQSPVWVNGYGGNSYEAGRAVCVDVFGNVYSAGLFEDTADFNPGTGVYNLISAGGYDVFVQKTDANGNFIWAVRMGGPGNDEAMGIEADGFGNVIVTGYFNDSADFDPGVGSFLLSSAGYTDIFICKLNPNGNLIWAERIGGTYSEEGYGITTDINQNIFVTGEFQNTVDFDPGAGSFNLFAPNLSDDAYIVKLNSAGGFEWATSFSGPNLESGFEVEADYAGNVYTTGRFMDTIDCDPGPGVYNLTPIGIGGEEGYLVKLSAAGNFIWALQLGGGSADEAYTVDVNGQGEVCVGGIFRGVADLDPTAGTQSVTSAGDTDYYIVKLDSSGNFIWGNAFGGNTFDYCYDIALDPYGNVYASGYFWSIMDFDPGTSSQILDPQQGYVFMQVLNINGDYVWAGQLNANLILYVGESLDADAEGYMYLTGDYWQPNDLDPGTGTITYPSSGYADAFTMKFALESAGIPVASNRRAIALFPNPCGDVLNISGFHPGHVRCVITDVTGRIVSEKVYADAGESISFDVSALLPGVYEVMLWNDEALYQARFVRAGE